MASWHQEARDWADQGVTVAEAARRWGMSYQGARSRYTSAKSMPTTANGKRRRALLDARRPLAYLAQALGSDWVDERLDGLNADECEVAINRLYAALRVDDLDAEDEIVVVRARLREIRRESIANSHLTGGG